MNSLDTFAPAFTWLGWIVLAAPATLLAGVGLSSLVGAPLSEQRTQQLTQSTVTTGLLAALAIFVLMLLSGSRHVSLELGNWVVISDEHFHFTLKFVFDRLSIPFVILSFLLVGTIGKFANVYLHREAGFNRFFVLYAIFLLGMVVASLAGTIETMFVGWELVGLSSALLVAYFHERPAPVRSGLQVWTVYRLSDAAFLVAALSLHHLKGEGDFALLFGAEPWPGGQASLSFGHALLVGSLLLFAAAGKSALLPFSGWLPKAMEGPTPSSAVFYGALSVHLGAFLLLRVSPIFAVSWWLSAAVVTLGLATALYAALAGRVQTDIKSALAFASLTQVGIIVAEIGCGLRYVALVHLIGHACLRTLQLLRAPTLLRDYHALENALGEKLPRPAGVARRWLPEALRRWTYRFALERGFLDIVLHDYVVGPFLGLFRICDALERRWTDLLAGRPSRESDLVSPATENLEDLA